MTTTLIICRVYLMSMIREYRHNTHVQIGLCFIMLFYAVLAYWSILHLQDWIQAWQVTGKTALTAGLWSLCTALWCVFGGITALGTLQRGLSTDTALLLHTLPLTPATRLRALYGQMTLEWLWNWLLITIIVIGTSLGIQLQWGAIPWLWLLLVGIGWAVWLGIVLPLLMLRYMLPHWRVALPLLGIVLVGIIGLVSAFPASVVRLPTPAFAALVLLILLTLSLGPLAGRAGRLYEAVFVFNQSRNRSQMLTTLPGTAWIITRLSRERNLTSALLVRELRSQSRNLIGWLRLIMLGVYMSAFPFVFDWSTTLGLKDLLVVFGYLSILVLVTIIDSMSSPLGSEGDRLALYLTAPIDHATLLRAKMIAFGVPLIILGYLMLLCISVWIQLHSETLLYAGLLFTLSLSGITVLFVCGSTIDVNLHLGIEGATQMLLYEESPITLQRLALVSLAALLVIAQLVIVWQYTPFVALLWLCLLNGCVSVGMWFLAHKVLQRLVM